MSHIGLGIAEAGRFSSIVDLKNKSSVKHKSVIEARYPRFWQYLVTCRFYSSGSSISYVTV